MRIDIWSDLVCPWCYIGKRRFERALGSFPHRADVQVVHRSFQLDPTIPQGAAVSQRERLLRKYGLSPAELETMQERMAHLAAEEGLVFSRADGLMGNTTDGHRLVHLAGDRGLQDAVIERLYRAHFSERRSIFDPDSLLSLAAEAGLDADDARRVLETDAYEDGVRADQEEARRLGATGVPFFVIDHRFGVSGAQPTEVFAGALARAWSESPVKTSA